jgi:hypothetical protein
MFEEDDNLDPELVDVRIVNGTAWAQARQCRFCHPTVFGT